MRRLPSATRWGERGQVERLFAIVLRGDHDAEPLMLVDDRESAERMAIELRAKGQDVEVRRAVRAANGTVRVEPAAGNEPNE
jgi:hypothetical protein